MTDIDWAAVGAIAACAAAFTAAVFWAVDTHRKAKERESSARVLSQVMIAPVAAAQVDIAAIRQKVAPPDGDTSLIQSALYSQEGRDELSQLALSFNLELPPQLMDQGGVIPERVSNRLAYALATASRLKVAAKLLANLPHDSDQQDINDHTHALLTVLMETVTAVDQAYNVLLVAGRASR